MQHICLAQQLAFEQLLLTHKLPSVLACGLRIARLIQQAGGCAPDALSSGASASGSTGAWQLLAPSLDSAGSQTSAVNILHAAAPAASCRQGGDALAQVQLASTAAMDACSQIGRTTEQSDLSCSELACRLPKCQHDANSHELPGQDNGSTGGATRLVSATLPFEAACGQVWREPHAEEEQGPAVRCIAACSRKLEAAWMQRFAHPAALSTVLGLDNGSQHSCVSDVENGGAAQLPWHQRLVATLQLLEVLLDSCVLRHSSQPQASARPTAVLKLLELHLHVRDMLSQYTGKHPLHLHMRSSQSFIPCCAAGLAQLQQGSRT